jgi:hypothetical protein
MKEGEEAAMRIRKAFLSSAVMAAGLIAATGAMAQVAPPGPAPTSCQAGNTIVSVTAGPAIVNCPDSTTGQCTEIQYSVSGSASDFTSTDHLGALEGLGVAYVKGGTTFCSPSPCSIFPAGQGDPLTDLGRLAVHEQAVRVNPNDIKSTSFTIGLVGARSSSPTSVVVKKGKAINSCRIQGIGGADAGGNPLATFTSLREDVVGPKNCTIRATTDKTTGVTTVQLTQGSINNGCSLEKINLPDVELTVNGRTGPIEYSEGISVVVGTGTCSLKQYYAPAGAWYWICW